MPRGKKTGGRQKGTPNKRKQSFRDGLRAYCDDLNVDPHKFMADMIADNSEIVAGVDDQGQPILRPAVSKELKLNAAKELAQYIEPKLKAVEHSGEMAQTIIQVTLE